MVAPVQQSFYFVNDGMSADGRYLWLYCAFPPSPRRTLAAVDFLAGEMRHFPETQFSSVSPYVDPESGDLFWATGPSVWRRGPRPADVPRVVNTLPEELIGARGVTSIASHLIPSAHGREFFIDAKAGLQYLLGALPLDGGDFGLWQRLDRHHSHGQFSPTDPDTALVAEELHNHPLTGLTFPITNRLWLIRRGQKPRPILREPRWVTHEWWEADGKHVWCVWKHETLRVRVADGEVESVAFPRHCWYSHSSRNGRLIVGDSNTGFFRGCASTVHFMNRDTGKTIVLAEHAERRDYIDRTYHIDPHPRFCCGDRYVVFTTTVRGDVDVAVVPTESLIDHTT
jgi:hypothetical protein